jgi:hypothetical protein
MKRSIALRAALTVSLFATLPACTTSQASKPPPHFDPVIEQRTEVRTLCPAEIAAAVPDPILVPPGLVLAVPVEVLTWLRAHFARESLLARRLEDAKGQCPHD